MSPFGTLVTFTNSPQPMLVRSQYKATGAGRYVAHQVSADQFTPYEAYDIPDWDGYGALPISLNTVNAARSFYRLFDRDVPPCDMAPGADGTIGFEWRIGAPGNIARVLIDVGPGGRVFARRIDASGTMSAFPPTRVETGARQLLHEIFSA